MKIKNSYILLIGIAIFLLISIGSVCASENVTDNSDVPLADDGADVVLSNTSDTEGNVPDDTQTEKINTTVKTNKDSYEFKQDSNKTVTVEVKDNKSSNINVNKSDLSVMNGNKSVSFDYTGTLMTITEALPVGNYNLTINYLGNEQYINSSKVIAVKIYGNNTIETVTSVVCNGKDIEIPVKVNDGVDYIELNKDNFNLTLIYTNETGNISNLTIKAFTIENNTIKFNTDVTLIAASLKIDYVNATEPKTVNIKVSTQVKADKDEYKFKSEENKTISITILDGQENQLNVVKNDLKVFDNGNEIDFKYNNSVMTLTLNEGVHNLTIAYKGNVTYNASNSSAIIIKVSGNNTINVPETVVSEGKTVEIPVTLFDGSENIDLTYDFTLNLTYTDKTGNVTSAVLSAYDIVDGKIKFDVDAYKWIKASVNVNYVNSTGSKNVKILLTSSVNATAENKYRNNETNNITVTVKDNEGNVLNVAKADLQVLDNGKNIAFTYNNSIINVNLEDGVHNITIIYKGNDTYVTSNTTIEQKVYGNVRFNPDAVAVLDDNTQVTITINLNDGADLVDINETKLNVTVFRTLNNVTTNQTVEYDLNGQNITFDLDADFDSAYAVIKYSEGNLTATTQIKVNTEIDVDNGASIVTLGETEDKNLRIIITGLTADSGHNINVTKDNIQILKDGKALNIDVNNSIVTIKDAFKFGVYNLTVKYLGDSTFLESVKNITLKVYGLNATTPINVNSSKKGEVKVGLIVGNETEDMNVTQIQLNVTYKNGNNTVVIPVTVDKYENGTLYFTLENGNFTTATLNIKYDNTEKNVTLNRIYNAKIVIVNNVNEYRTGNFTFRLVDADDGSNITGKTIKLTTVGNIRAGFSATTDANGIASFKTINLYEFNNNGVNGGSISLSQIDLDVGNHSVDLESDGNVKAAKVTTNLTITQGHFKIVVDPYKEYFGTDKPVTVTVTNSLGEPVPGIIVKLTIDKLSGEYYLYTNTSGVGRISIYNTETKSGLVGGNYVFTASNNDTKNIAPTSAKGTVTVLKIPTTISAKDVTVQYNTGKTSTITVKDKNGKAVSGMYLLVRLYATSKKYSDYLFQTNSKGQVTFSASLDVGKHKMIVTSADNRYDAKQVTKTITVKKIKAKLTAKKVNTYYKAGKYFTVKLTNAKNKKAVYAAEVNIKIFVSKNRYYNYNGQTGMNGQLKLLLDSLKPGTYKVEVSSASNKNYDAKKVTSKIVIKKATAKLTPKKLTAKKGAKKYFKVTVKNKKTKKVIKGVKVKVKVYTGKKAKTYKIKTNSKGIAKLSVKKLKVGKHKVVVTSADKYVVAKKAKSTIKIKR